MHLCDPRRLSLSGSPVGAVRWGESFYLEVHRGRLAAALFEFKLNLLAFVKLGQSRLLSVAQSLRAVQTLRTMRLVVASRILTLRSSVRFMAA